MLTANTTKGKKGLIFKVIFSPYANDSSIGEKLKQPKENLTMLFCALTKSEIDVILHSNSGHSILNTIPYVTRNTQTNNCQNKSISASYK
jgi:aspartokinase